MYTRDHGKVYIKDVSYCWRKAVKRGKVKALRQQDRREQDQHAEPRCPYCDDNHCGGWCG